MKIGYARTSTDHDQDLGRQIKQLLDDGVLEHLIFRDGVQSGARDPDKRPGYKQVLQFINTGEIIELVVTDLSRLGRDAKGTLQEIWRLQDTGIQIRSLDPMDTIIMNAQPELQPLLMSAVTLGADLQRKKTIEDTKAGLARAKSAGKELGRPRVKIDPAKIKSWMDKGLSERAAITVCGYAHTTYYRWKKNQKEDSP